MVSLARILTLCAVIAIGAFNARTAFADPLVFDYHGWHVDLTRARGAEPPKQMADAVIRQLDIVEHVGLKSEVVDFMRTLPIWANPAAAKAGPGRYGSRTGVDLRVKALDPDKPIILHEFLHAYHDRLMPGGFNNPEIREFFNRGRLFWTPDSYMMSNEREFFAVTASVYLFGSIDREPYSRAELRSRQPAYYQWLARLFDDGRPRS